MEEDSTTSAVDDQDPPLVELQTNEESPSQREVSTGCDGLATITNDESGVGLDSVDECKNNVTTESLVGHEPCEVNDDARSLGDLDSLQAGDELVLGAAGSDSGVEGCGRALSSGGGSRSCASSVVSCGSGCGSESSSVAGAPPRPRRRVNVAVTEPKRSSPLGSSTPRPVTAPRGPNLATRERARSREKPTPPEKPRPLTPKPRIRPTGELPNLVRESPALRAKPTKTSTARCRTPNSPSEEKRWPSNGPRLTTPTDSNATRVAADKYGTLPRRRRENGEPEGSPKHDVTPPTSRRPTITRSVSTRSTTKTRVRIYAEKNCQTVLLGTDVESALAGITPNIECSREITRCHRGVQASARDTETTRLAAAAAAAEAAAAEERERRLHAEAQLAAERAARLAAIAELERNSQRLLELAGAGECSVRLQLSRCHGGVQASARDTETTRLAAAAAEERERRLHAEAQLAAERAARLAAIAELERNSQRLLELAGAGECSVRLQLSRCHGGVQASARDTETTRLAAAAAEERERRLHAEAQLAAERAARLAAIAELERNSQRLLELAGAGECSVRLQLSRCHGGVQASARDTETTRLAAAAAEERERRLHAEAQLAAERAARLAAIAELERNSQRLLELAGAGECSVRLQLSRCHGGVQASARDTETTRLAAAAAEERERRLHAEAQLAAERAARLAAIAELERNSQRLLELAGAGECSIRLQLSRCHGGVQASARDTETTRLAAAAAEERERRLHAEAQLAAERAARLAAIAELERNSQRLLELAGAGECSVRLQLSRCHGGVQASARDTETTRLAAAAAEERERRLHAEAQLAAERAARLAAIAELERNSQRLLELAGAGAGAGAEGCLRALEEQLRAAGELAARQRGDIDALRDHCDRLHHEACSAREAARVLEARLAEAEREAAEMQDFLAAETGALGDSLREAEAELARANKDLERRRAECRQLVRMCEQRRQEALGAAARARSGGGAAHALDALGRRLARLTDAVARAYSLPRHALEPQVYHNEAFSRSDSGEALSPDDERGGLLTAVARAFRAAPAPAPAPATALPDDERSRVSDDNDNSADLLDSETEPCLVTDPECAEEWWSGAEAGGAWSGEELSPSRESEPGEAEAEAGSASERESLRTLSAAIAQRQRSEAEDAERGSLLERVLALDARLSELLRALRLAATAAADDDSARLAQALRDKIDVTEKNVADVVVKKLAELDASKTMMEQYRQSVEALKKQLAQTGEEDDLDFIEEELSLCSEGERRLRYEALDAALAALGARQPLVRAWPRLARLQRRLERLAFAVAQPPAPAPAPVATPVPVPVPGPAPLPTTA